MKKLFWIASSQKDLRKLPREVQEVFAHGLNMALHGRKHPDAKPFKGFSGAGVLEIVDDYKSDTYRAVYTVRFRNAIYVLHVFQKKSKRKTATPKQDIELVKSRLKRAQEQHEELES